MQHTYVLRNRKFEQIIDTIESFFESRGFSVSSVCNGHRCKVLVSESGLGKVTEVEIKIDSERISIRYVPVISRKIVLLSPILSLIGGGILVINYLKLKEKMQKIEKDFWQEMDAFLRSKL